MDYFNGFFDAHIASTKQSYISMSSIHAILIGCSVRAISDENMKARDCVADNNNNTENKSESENEADRGIPNPLGGVQKDLVNMEAFLRSKGVVKFTILLPTGENRDETISEMNTSGEVLLVYYSGHGRRGDGAWCIQNGESNTSYITPSNFNQEIRKTFFLTPRGKSDFVYYDEMFQSSAKEFKTIIISDSCFSGHWAEFNWPTWNEYSIFSSSDHNEVSFDSSIRGGKFTNALIAANNGNYIPEVLEIDQERRQSPKYFHGVEFGIKPIGQPSATFFIHKMMYRAHDDSDSDSDSF